MRSLAERLRAAPVDRDSIRSRRRPSRIYAGSQPLPPVHPLVPLALVAPLVAVWQVRAYFVEAGAALGEQHFGSFASSVPGLGVERVNRLVLACYGAALVCMAVVVNRWWRGRREWGDVPLAFGIGACCWCLLFLGWTGFGPDGELVDFDGMLAWIGSQAGRLFAILVGFLGYMVIEMATRWWRERRLTLAALVVVPIGLLLVPRLDSARFMGWGPSPSILGSTSRPELPRAVAVDMESPLARRRWFGAGWNPMYVARDGRLAPLRARFDPVEGWRTSAAVPLEAIPQGSPVGRSTAPFDRAQLRRDVEALPSGRVAVWLPADAPATWLFEAASDCREHLPGVWLLLVQFTSHTDAAPATGYERQVWWPPGELAVLRGDRPCKAVLEVDTEGFRVERLPGPYPREAYDHLALRVEAGVTMQQLVDAMVAVTLEEGRGRVFVID